MGGGSVPPIPSRERIVPPVNVILSEEERNLIGIMNLQGEKILDMLKENPCLFKTIIKREETMQCFLRQLCLTYLDKDVVRATRHKIIRLCNDLPSLSFFKTVNVSIVDSHPNDLLLGCGYSKKPTRDQFVMRMKKLYPSLLDVMHFQSLFK